MNQAKTDNQESMIGEPTIHEQIQQLLAGLEHLPEQLRHHKNGILYSALESLHSHIRDPELAGPGHGHDLYVIRANAYAVALANAGYLSLAQDLYERIVDVVEKFRGDDPTSPQWRHLGMIYLNLGVTQARAGNLDRSVPSFIRARTDDRRTYGQEGQIIHDFYETDIRQPTLDMIYQVCHSDYDAVMPLSLDKKVLRQLSSFLDDLEYALFATLRSLAINSKENTRTPNLYSQLQMLNGLGNLCSLFEAMVKRIGERNNDPNVQARYQNRPTRFTLKAALNVLYDGEKAEANWWSRVDTGWASSTSFDQTQPGAKDFDTQLAALLAMPLGNEADLRVVSLFVTGLVRNFIGHERDPNSAIAQGSFDDCLKFILLALILTHQKAQTRGQL